MVSYGGTEGQPGQGRGQVVLARCQSGHSRRLGDTRGGSRWGGGVSLWKIRWGGDGTPPNPVPGIPHLSDSSITLRNSAACSATTTSAATAACRGQKAALKSAEGDGGDREGVRGCRLASPPLLPAPRPPRPAVDGQRLSASAPFTPPSTPPSLPPLTRWKQGTARWQ